jgi:hypothetical protein
VYITNRSPTHDYAAAARFGAIRFVTTGNLAVFKTSRLQQEIIEALAYSMPSDYLLFSGSSAIAALAFSVWMEMHGRANILLWDRQADQYVERTINRSELRVEIEQTRDKLQIEKEETA